MLNIKIEKAKLEKDLQSLLLFPSPKLDSKQQEEQTLLLILRDLMRLNWKVNFKDDKVEIVPPVFYDKEVIKTSMAVKRQEIITANKKWIDAHLALARKNLADGLDVLKSKIKPVIEICETQKQHDLFRIFRYYWSSPYSEYVGRRIKIIVRDAGLPKKPVIGIAALGSPIIHIPERDEWVEWDKEHRTQNLIYTMDAYIIGALPPYNYLLGGKLISYILASNEVRKLYAKKYKDSVTIIKKRKANKLACIFTTSLYGKSAQYNRIKFKKRLLYNPIGQTKGYGTLHLSMETMESMRDLLENKGIKVENKFGDGPSWAMRVIRSAGDALGFDSDTLLKHSFKRDIYAIPLAKNMQKFLKSESKKLEPYDYPLDKLVRYWKKRWFKNRIKNSATLAEVVKFQSQDFQI